MYRQKKKLRRDELVSITLDNVRDLKVIVFGIVTFRRRKKSDRLQNDSLIFYKQAETIC